MQATTSLNVNSGEKNQTSHGGTRTLNISKGPTEEPTAGPRSTQPSYTRTVGAIGANAVQESRQRLPISMTNPTRSGSAQDVAWVPPHLRVPNTSQNTAPVSMTHPTRSEGNQGMAWVPPHLRGSSTSQSTVASMTGSTRPRPELRGMTDPSSATILPPHLRGGYSTGVGSSTAVSTEEREDNKTLGPRGNRYNQTTDRVSGTSFGTLFEPPAEVGTRPVRISRSGWAKGVRYMKRAPLTPGSKTNRFDRTIERGSLWLRTLRWTPRRSTLIPTTVRAVKMKWSDWLCQKTLVPIATKR